MKTKIESTEVIISALVFIFIGSILYYINYLEKAECNCVSSWHHNYIKYFTYFMFIAPIMIIWYYAYNRNNIVYILFAIYSIFFIVYLYSIYKYVNQLNDTQCSCAIHNMKYLHNSLYYIFNILAYIITNIFKLVVFAIILSVIVYFTVHIMYTYGDEISAAIKWIKNSA